MESAELSDSFIDYIKDQPILHPCFRLEDVKEALDHIEKNLGLVRKFYPDIKSTFFYMLKDMPLAIMVTPTHYSNDRMCYAFRALFPDKFPISTITELKSSKSTPWFTIPSHLYVKLLEKVKFNDVQYFVELFESKRLLPAQNTHFEPDADLEIDADFDIVPQREYSWEDVETLLTLEAYGFRSPSFYEFTMFLFKGIKPFFLKKLAALGFTHFTLADIEVIWQQKIPLHYLEEMAQAGYGRFKAVEYFNLFQEQVPTTSVQILTDRGYTSLSSEELIRLTRTYTKRRQLPLTTSHPRKSFKKVLAPLQLLPSAASGNSR